MLPTKEAMSGERLWMVTEYDADGEPWRCDHFPGIDGAMAAVARWTGETAESFAAAGDPNEHLGLGRMYWRVEQIDEEEVRLNPPFHDRTGIEHAERMERSYDPEDLIR